jgi:hypothetical protein
MQRLLWGGLVFAVTNALQAAYGTSHWYVRVLLGLAALIGLALVLTAHPVRRRVGWIDRAVRRFEREETGTHSRTVTILNRPGGRIGRVQGGRSTADQMFDNQGDIEEIGEYEHNPPNGEVVGESEAESSEKEEDDG